jgi:hypothetical protein
MRTLLFLLCVVGSAHFALSQSLERKVFSSGGGAATLGIHTYNYTIGEPIIGTVNGAGVIFTKGFQQPIPVVAVLAFELKNFQARWTEAGVQLSWQSNLDPGAGIFEIERSPDGQNFELLSQQESAGGTGALNAYAYQDASQDLAGQERYWYRVRLLSFAGQMTLSPVVAVHGSRLQPDWQLFPNPSRGDLWLSLYCEQEAMHRLSVSNAMGQVVWQRQENLVPGQATIALPLSALPAGMYHLSIQSPFQQGTTPFIIQH